MRKREYMKCFFCGKRARRVPSTKGLDPGMLDEKGQVRVVLRKRTVQPYGVCGAQGHVWYSDGCPHPMLRPKDARFVLKAALEYERGGHNIRSEFDI